MFLKINVLRNLPIFTGKNLRWSPFLINLKGLRPATLFKREFNTGIFLWTLRNFTNTNGFFHKIPPVTLSAVLFFQLFFPIKESAIQTRSSFQKLNIPRRKTNIRLKSLSYTGPSLWYNLNENLKRSSSINNFKHKIKEFYFEELKNMNLNKRP